MFEMFGRRTDSTQQTSGIRRYAYSSSIDFQREISMDSASVRNVKGLMNKAEQKAVVKKQCLLIFSYNNLAL